MDNTNGLLLTSILQPVSVNSNTPTLQQTIQSDLSKSWQGWIVAGLILGIGGYAVYKILKW